jgi:cytochrome P450
MHEKYGPTVRVRPNELTFVDPRAWQDIYGHKVPGRMAGLHPGTRELPKFLSFYKIWDKQPESIVTAPHDTHAALRKLLAPSFSERALREQEPIVTSYVDQLLTRLHENASAETPLDMTSWYNRATFDIIGDLAFGESFHCLDKSDYHPFIQFIFRSPRESARLIAVRYLGLKILALALLLPLTRSGLAINRHATTMMEKRVSISKTRPDLIQPFIDKKAEGKISFEEVRQMARILIFAGSETTASTLSGVTYLLLSNPDALKRATEEVRSAFKSEGDINLSSVQGLTYMLACLNESLRYYPPVASGTPRITPDGGAIICGHNIPKNVSKALFSPHLHTINHTQYRRKREKNDRSQTIVSVQAWSAHHFSANWVDSFEYRPERWLADSEYANDKKETFRPFSIGPRDCIGKK